MARNSILFEDFLRRGMDARVKPAHDEVAAWKKSLVVQARFPDAVPKARLRASSTRNGAALAERCTAEPGTVTDAGACYDPGSAKQRFALHRARETGRCYAPDQL